MFLTSSEALTWVNRQWYLWDASCMQNENPTDVAWHTGNLKVTPEVHWSTVSLLSGLVRVSQWPFCFIHAIVKGGGRMYWSEEGPMSFVVWFWLAVTWTASCDALWYKRPQWLMQYGWSKAAGEEVSDACAMEVRFAAHTQAWWLSGPLGWAISPLAGTKNTLALALFSSFWESNPAPPLHKGTTAFNIFLSLQSKILPESMHTKVPRVSHNWPKFLDPKGTMPVNREARFLDPVFQQLCYGLKICVLQKSYVEALTLQCDYIWRWGL